jgi:hypothetical protein
MKYFFGISSKSQVDSIIEFSLAHKNIETIFIPSRRQVEYNGGYVNNWTTKEFSLYVKNLNPLIKIERDHGGPFQGLIDDDGYESLTADCKYLDVIHLDPWKKYPKLDEGIQWTIDMINYCYMLNNNICYEIGTEEAIRHFSIAELETLILTLQKSLDPCIYNKIKYCVVQCGNALCNGKNSSIYDEIRLKEMLALVKKYNFIAKEHNGDWVDVEVIKKKESVGLECINIAPEFGMIETNIILEKIKENKEHYDKVYQLCIESGKWKKWVNDDFDVTVLKNELISLTGHYIFSNPEFIEIKNQYAGIEAEIKSSITNKLLELNFIYEKRTQCIFCNTLLDTTLFLKDYTIPVSSTITNSLNDNFFIPYNVFKCTKCYTMQNKYLSNLSLLYGINHIDNYGTCKNLKHVSFSTFIIINKNIDGIVEIGGCQGILANEILSTIDTNYTIIEPSYTGNKSSKLSIINDFIENVDLSTIKANTIVMSDVFEHFYKPNEIIKKIYNNSQIKYIYLNHPDFDYSIKDPYFYINLNNEHTFFIKHSFLFTIFNNHGFKLNKQNNFNNMSKFFEFERSESAIIEKPLIHSIEINTEIMQFFNHNLSNVNKINNYINENTEKKYYMWPASLHSTILFTFGLNYKNFVGMLDNSPNKIGKYIYGYNLPIYSFTELLNTNDENVCIILGSVSNYINEINLNDTKVKLIYLSS